MKKVILALAIVSVSFAACNDTGKTDPTTTDSPKVETPPVKVDSPAVKVDSPAVKIDSPAVAK
ncbi:MAG: hypothetical protein ACKVOM_12290 [Ferruginibacter sp.]